MTPGGPTWAAEPGRLAAPGSACSTVPGQTLALNLFLKRVPAELRVEHEAALGMG
jgi:hypothetical protein